MNKQEIKEYLKEHLQLDITEEDFGFNGRHHVITLTLEGEVISEELITITSDTG